MYRSATSNRGTGFWQIWAGTERAAACLPCSSTAFVGATDPAIRFWCLCSGGTPHNRKPSGPASAGLIFLSAAEGVDGIKKGTLRVQFADGGGLVREAGRDTGNKWTAERSVDVLIWLCRELDRRRAFYTAIGRLSDLLGASCRRPIRPLRHRLRRHPRTIARLGASQCGLSLWSPIHATRTPIFTITFATAAGAKFSS
jgi:hypothetical protein